MSLYDLGCVKSAIKFILTFDGVHAITCEGKRENAAVISDCLYDRKPTCVYSKI